MPLELLTLPQQSVENSRGGDKRRIHESSCLSKLERPGRDGKRGPPSSSTEASVVVKTLRDDNARLHDEVRRLKHELNHLRGASASASASSSLSARIPPRSTSLQVQRRGSDDNEYGESTDDLLHVRSWHDRTSDPAKETCAPMPPPPPSRDVEAHQSSQGLHHRRVGAPTTSGAEWTLNVEATTTSTNARPRRLAVTDGGAHDDGDDNDGSGDDELVPCTAQASFAASPFCSRVKDRAGWLVGLLILQSMSSFIISRNEALLQSHLVIVQFLTMLVGSGGNAGNQAAVQAIRGLATGTVHEQNAKTFLVEELKMGVTLSAILGVAGLLRTAAFAVPLAETVAITTSLCTIVFISIVLGACLPLGMLRAGIDPAHSSTTIQVLMDILGVSITVLVSSAILDTPLHPFVEGTASQN